MQPAHERLMDYSFPAFPTNANIVAMTGIIDRMRFRWDKKADEEGLLAGLSSQVPMGGLVRLLQLTTPAGPPSDGRVLALTRWGFKTYWAPRRKCVVAFFEAGQGCLPRFPVSFTRPQFGHAGRYD